MLTDIAVRTAKPSEKPIRIADSHGLLLEIRPNGSKLWRWRYRLAGVANMLALGSYPAVSLAQAREARDEARKLVKAGKNPAHERQAEVAGQVSKNADTFRAVAEEWIEATNKAKNWKPYYLRQINRFMASDVFPEIGHLPIRTINPPMILSILEGAVDRNAPVVAINLRQWCGAVFRYAIARHRADSDPTRDLSGVVIRPTVQHRRALNAKEIAELHTGLENYGGMPEVKLAVRLLLHTFVRTAELRNARWAEIDLGEKLWRIPAEKMKSKKPHIVPLSSQVVGMLQELHGFTGGREYLFPNTRRPEEVMSGTTINHVLERIGLKGFSGHGFRSTAATLLREMGFDDDIVELQLAHSDANKTRASYNHAKKIRQRAAMMQSWSDAVDGFVAKKVVPIRSAA